MTKERPIERCKECGSVYKMNYIGPPDDEHDHHHHEEVDRTKPYDVYTHGHLDLIEEQNKKKWAELVRPEYIWN